MWLRLNASRILLTLRHVLVIPDEISDPPVRSSLSRLQGNETKTQRHRDAGTGTETAAHRYPDENTGAHRDAGTQENVHMHADEKKTTPWMIRGDVRREKGGAVGSPPISGEFLHGWGVGRKKRGCGGESCLSGSIPAMRRLGSWAIISTVFHCSALALELRVQEGK